MIAPSILQVASWLVFTAVSWLLAAAFFFLARRVRQDPRVRSWAFAQLLFAVAPTLNAGMTLILYFGGVEALGFLQIPALPLLMLGGVLFSRLFGAWKVYEGIHWQRRQRPPLRRQAFAPLAAGALCLAISQAGHASGWMLLLLGAGMGFLLLLGARLLPPPSGRPSRTEGEWIAGAGLQALGLFWTLAAIQGLQMVAAPEHAEWLLFDALGLMMKYQGFVLTVLHSALGIGLLLMLAESLHARAQAALEHEAALSLQLERSLRSGALGGLAASVAHDLANPLTAILGFAGELEESAPDAARREAAATVREQAERCRAILARLANGQQEPVPSAAIVDPGELVRSVMRPFAFRVREAGVELELRLEDDLPAVGADPHGIGEALDNLTDNALRATPRGGKIALGVEAAAGGVAITVRDGGAGVPEHLRARIFEPFFSTREKGNGSGIGLSLALSLVRSQRGTLTLDPPRAGQTGACFRLWLPAAAAIPQPAQRGSELLLAEGDVHSRRVLARWLERRGWRIQEARSAEDALARARRLGPERVVLLCDEAMVCSDGTPLYRRLMGEDAAWSKQLLLLADSLRAREQDLRASGLAVLARPLNFALLESLLMGRAPKPVQAALTSCLLAVLSLAAVSCGSRSGGAAAPDPAGLYAQHCALCHGPEGAGDGIVRLDRPARSFRDGGFSFGNTEEAIYRTITSGIGGTPMPGFAQTLAEEERRAVARHVIALGPEQPPAPGPASILAVGDRPVVVRGQFQPLAEGGPDFPRGLLIGNPDGLSYQYRADDLRLLAVRQGPFVDRKDWGERGGLPLEPLGRLIHLEDDRPEWSTPAGAARAVLVSTRVDGELATLRYRVEDAQGRQWAMVEERARASNRRAASGFVREFVVEPLVEPEQPRFEAPGEQAGVMVRVREEAAGGARRRFAVEVLLLPQDTPAARQALREELDR